MLRTYLNYFLLKMKNEKGQGMVEYALIIGLVSIVAIAVLITLGGSISNVFQEIVNKLPGGGTPTPEEGESFGYLFF